MCVCMCVLYVVTFRELIGQSRVGARAESAGLRERCVLFYFIFLFGNYTTNPPNNNSNNMYSL